MWFLLTLTGGGYASLLFLSQSVLCYVMWEACSNRGGGKKEERKERKNSREKKIPSKVTPTKKYFLAFYSFF